METKPILNDPARRATAEALDAMGLDMTAASRRLGRNAAYFQQYLKKGKPAELPQDVQEWLAEGSGKPLTAFKGSGRPYAPKQAVEAPNARFGPPGALPAFGRIPVFGQAVGGSDGRFIFNGQTIAHVLAPPSLASVRDAYAVYVAGESMEPRYRAGETVYVHPHMPVRKGDFVLVQIKTQDGEAPEGYIKEFVSQDTRRLRLVQLNPKREVEFPTSKVLSVHKIVLAGE